MNEIWIHHFSASSWCEERLWIEFLSRAEDAIGARLTRIDDIDPPRKQPSSLADAAKVICRFGASENNRWVFGVLKKSRIEISIQHSKCLSDYPNILSWSMPASFAEVPENRKQIQDLFRVGNAILSPFYGYADRSDFVAQKKKPSGSVDICSELVGVFWITYFGAPYVRFFGDSKFSALANAVFDQSRGVTVTLGESPETVPVELRDRIAAGLDARSFVDPRDSNYKVPGRYALTFSQLQPAQVENK